MLGRGRLDDRPQVAQRLKLVRVDHATIELDGYGLRNGAHSRVGGRPLPGAQTCLGPRACAYSLRSLHRDLALAVLVLRNAEQLAVCEEVKELVGGPKFGQFKGASVRGSSDGPR